MQSVLKKKGRCWLQGAGAETTTCMSEKNRLIDVTSLTFVICYCVRINLNMFFCQDRIDLPLSCSPAPTFPPRRFAATRRLLLSLPPHAGRPRLRDPPPAPVKEAAAAAVEEYKAPPLRLLDPPQEEEPYPDEVGLPPVALRCAAPSLADAAWAMCLCADGGGRPGLLPDRVRPDDARAYGVEFLEGPDGMGVYASRDIEPLRRARVIMEIPLELMLTITKNHPWMFFPDIIPLGHPIFDIIESTNPETDWDLRLACLLLYAFDVENSFWQSYGDFLPSGDECTSLLLAPKEDLMELEDEDLSSEMLKHQQRAVDFLAETLGKSSIPGLWGSSCTTTYIIFLRY
ncbi:protein PLASTID TRANSCRIPTIONALLY ACTIVE 14 [Hordeum vulgare]|nr:protein PLASTID TRANSCRIPTIONALLY ACTIVE 14 [Hordeum vulgare]